MVDSKRGTLDQTDPALEIKKDATSEKSPQTVVHSVKIERTKFLNQILKLLQLEEREEKDECTTRQKIIYIVVLAIFLALFIASLGGFCILWFTNYYEAALQANLVLANGTTAKKWWIDPPVNPLMKVHIFNYTNADAFLAGYDEKLIVEDLGPLTYKEVTTKVDLQHHDDNTITYRENRAYEFLPFLSDIQIFDKVTVPNIPFIIADRKISGLTGFTQFSAKTIINALTPTPKPFLTVPLSKFLWGYDDPIVDSYKTLATFTGEKVLFEKFGMLRTRNGTSSDTYRVHSGIGDISLLGKIVAANGKSEMDFYHDDRCNQLNGTDGSQFPPHLMDKKSPLVVYINNLCRNFPLVFDQEVSVFNGIPAWRYKNPPNVFGTPDENPENQCYCDIDTGKCPPSGVFNISRCAYDTPILTSFPHFYLGDPKLIKNFTGLRPQEKLHETYADVHPTLAFPLGGVSRFQMNVELNHNPAFDSFKRLVEKYSILPIVWLEVTGGDIPADFQELIYKSTHSVNAIQSNLKYATLIIMLISFAGCILVFNFLYRRPKAPPVVDVRYAQDTVQVINVDE